MTDVMLVLDFGTSNVRAVLLDCAGGQVQAKVSVQNLWLSTEGGRSEMDAEAIWEHAQEAVRGVLELRPSSCRICGMSFSFFGDGLIVAGEDLQPLRPMIMAFDVRAQKEAAEITERIGEERFRVIAGSPCFSMLVPSKLLWLRKQEPEVVAGAAYFLNIQEYMHLHHRMYNCRSQNQ